MGAFSNLLSAGHATSTSDSYANMNAAKQHHADLDVYAVPVLDDPTDDRTGKNTDLSTFQRHEWSHALC